MREIYRVVDANLNRAREGLRVLEEVARLILDDAGLSLRIKEMRHGLAAAAGELPGGPRELLRARDAAGDVGSGTWTPGEKDRRDLDHLVLANIKRVQEASRVLEEFGKLLNPELTGFKKIRFEAYVLEKDLLAGLEGRSGGGGRSCGDGPGRM